MYHVPALVAGKIPMQDDVRVFYFPLLVATSDALHRATLPLWTPEIFGGYPLFADGEAGMLYPLHLLTLPWLAPESSLVLLHLLHSFLAAVGAYIFLRTLRSGRLGALVAAIVYAYSGFAAGQIVHTSVFEAMAWLPFALAFTERALQSTDRQRLLPAVLAGAVVGVQALALHIQVTLMTGLAIAAFIAYRAVAPEGRAPGATRRALIALSVLGIVGTIGFALGAVQLLPLAELGTATYRGSGLAPSLGAVNSVWSGDLITLLLPNLHDTPLGGFWGPWVKWETVIYVGVLPLALAATGLVARAGPYRWFFGALATTALLLALGSGGPIQLWSALHEVPGFEVLRSPGRFSLLFALGIAVLAGYGADWLSSRARPHPTSALIVLAVGCALVLLLGWRLDQSAETIRSTGQLYGFSADQYLLVPGVPPSVDGLPLTALGARNLAADALALTNPATAWQIGLLRTCVLVFSLITLGGSLRNFALGLGLCLVFADLWVLGLTFHPSGLIVDLRPKVPPVLLQAADQPFRVYTPPTNQDKRTQLEPNRLLAVGIQEANGYSSLEPDRHAAYVNAVQFEDNELLDLWNVRYVVRRQRTQLFPSYAGTSFNPQRPLFSGRRVTPGTVGTLLPDGGPARMDQVLVVASLWGAAALPDGAIVAQITLNGVDGSTRVLPLRAGVDVSDAALDARDASVSAHGRADVAFQYQRTDPEGDRYAQQLYLGRLGLDATMLVKEVTIDQMGFGEGLQIYGVGLLDRTTGEVTQARDKRKYRLAYSDAEVRVYENTRVMPRSFIVGTARQAAPYQDILSTMLDGPFDPRTTAIIDGSIPEGLTLPDNGAAPINAGARIRTYRGEEVIVDATTDRDALLVLTDPHAPGWTADVDGRPAPILQADYLFRAVVLPRGTHTVSFRYEPRSLAVGALVSFLAVLVVLGVALRELIARRP